ncbi:hypothetical protein FXO37_00401 [Capsicum annuum]|nr:hypothetical protein FXO37_00401 [Capsicum annuum]
MLATIVLGAAQSPRGVASSAIAGHLVATSLAILGGAFLANYISEKLVGYLGSVLFLVFVVATLFGVFKPSFIEEKTKLRSSKMPFKSG